MTARFHFNYLSFAFGAAWNPSLRHLIIWCAFFDCVLEFRRVYPSAIPYHGPE